MADLYTGNSDGSCTNAAGSFAAARDGTAGADVNKVAAKQSNLTMIFPRKGLVIVSRSFFIFNTSGITGTVSSAAFKIFGDAVNTGSIIAVKSTAFGAGDLEAGDFSAITGFQTGASLDGEATDYSTAITTTGWSTSAYNNLPSTADLRADMQNNGSVIICVMNYTHDYLNSAPGSPVQIGGFYTNNPGTSKDPYIEYEVATGYGNKVLGVTAGNIAKVDGVATANIEKVIGV